MKALKKFTFIFGMITLLTLGFFNFVSPDNQSKKSNEKKSQMYCPSHNGIGNSSGYYLGPCRTGDNAYETAKQDLKSHNEATGHSNGGVNSGECY